MKRHESDLVSLVFALIFLFIASLWPLWQLGALGSGTLSWLPATALILIGLLGLALSVARARTTSRAGRRAGSAPDPDSGLFDLGHEYDAAPRYAGAEPESPSAAPSSASRAVAVDERAMAPETTSVLAEHPGSTEPTSVLGEPSGSTEPTSVLGEPSGSTEPTTVLGQHPGSTEPTSVLGEPSGSTEATRVLATEAAAGSDPEHVARGDTDLGATSPRDTDEGRRPPVS